MQYSNILHCDEVNIPSENNGLKNKQFVIYSITRFSHIFHLGLI